MSGCQCFTCRNKDNKDRVFGYETGYYEACKSAFDMLKNLGYKPTSVTDYKQNIGGIMAVIECNMGEAGEISIELDKELNK